jgi:hypothetical protein
MFVAERNFHDKKGDTMERSASENEGGMGGGQQPGTGHARARGLALGF